MKIGINLVFVHEGLDSLEIVLEEMIDFWGERKALVIKRERQHRIQIKE